MSRLDQQRAAFKLQVRMWATKLDVPMKALTIRPMSNKWASCSTSGYLTFNAELLNLDEDLQRYVIVHELLHFSVPNHGRLWKSLLRAHIGDYEELELRLKHYVSDSLNTSPA